MLNAVDKFDALCSDPSREPVDRDNSSAAMQVRRSTRLAACSFTPTRSRPSWCPTAVSGHAHPYTQPGRGSSTRAPRGAVLTARHVSCVLTHRAAVRCHMGMQGTCRGSARERWTRGQRSSVGGGRALQLRHRYSRTRRRTNTTKQPSSTLQHRGGVGFGQQEV